MSARGLGVEGVCRVQMITEHLCTLVQNTRFAGLYSVYERSKAFPKKRVGEHKTAVNLHLVRAKVSPAREPWH